MENGISGCADFEETFAHVSTTFEGMLGGGCTGPAPADSWKNDGNGGGGGGGAFRFTTLMDSLQIGGGGGGH